MSLHERNQALLSQLGDHLAVLDPVRLADIGGIMRALENNSQAQNAQIENLEGRIGDLEEQIERLEERENGLTTDLEEAREIPRRLADEALEVATTDPHDPAWDLYFRLRSLEGAA